MNFFRRPVKPTDADDEQLLTSYRQHGDLAVLGKLYEKQMPLVYGVCLKYLKDEELAQDAVMGIFEELITKVKQHDIKQFKSWLYVLSRNYCLMQLRSSKKMEVISLDDVMEFSLVLHPEDNNREEALQALEGCIEKLPAKQKQTVSLFYLNEKCYKEITEITGFSLNEVKSFIQNGKRNLKICLEKKSG
ncbi:MAG: RNA polymerase sigma factor [Mucilaginibacter sp.]|uniref:RNA polymerase sigma factor n=1 Tax=Mucilaginibacter sp. L3T2-6 TaxID=3062491 RepID=UPI0026770500|nr:sigma-70 family RNA polymerase sigma factor [Mucilaginibacter sp. L3T2-6]MDO3641814.1 sigma-70 family RNA polymerase sigma factor [Mucilaginibacter sp. L3T2-6]MDV6214508.1 sigma-70 family RNA polymerase sigma factor [Mucilaginibacter sp. L3T2-6]